MESAAKQFSTLFYRTFLDCHVASLLFMNCLWFPLQGKLAATGSLSFICQGRPLEAVTTTAASP